MGLAFEGRTQEEIIQGGWQINQFPGIKFFWGMEFAPMLVALQWRPLMGQKATGPCPILRRAGCWGRHNYGLS